MVLSSSMTLMGLQHVLTLTYSHKNTQGLLSFANTTDHPITRENIPNTNNNRNVITEKILNSTYFLQVNHLTSFDTLLICSLKANNQQRLMIGPGKI